MSIFRIHNQKVVFEKVRRLPYLHSVFNFEEAIGIAVMSIRGKVVQLPHLFLCRQIHPNQFYKSIDVYDWFTDKDWHFSFKLLEQTVIEELMREDGLTEEVAKEQFKMIFWPYYAKAINHAWDWYHKKTQQGQTLAKSIKALRDELRVIPGLKMLVLQFRKLRKMASKQSEFTLTSLLDPSSLYHNDFMPVYESIKGSEGGQKADGIRQN